MSMGDIYDGRRFYPIKAKPRPKQFASFDTEDDSRGKLLFVCFHSSETAMGFRDRNTALEFLYNLAPKKPLYLVAHNLEYDLVNLFRGRFGALEWNFFGGRLISARARDTRLVFWDSLNHSYHNPLSKLGDVVGLEKLESAHPWTNGAPFTKADERYCVRDAEIVVKYMRAVQEMYLQEGAECKSTTPATTMDLWRRCYLQEAIPALTKSTTRWFRGAYYGGRVEIFRLKAKSRIQYHDVNSLYPSVMLGPYPDLMSLEDGGEHGVIEATVDVPDMSIPPLPMRADGRLVFPIGRFRGRWCSCELDYAVSLGATVLIAHENLGSANLVYPFKKFIEVFYQKRMAADSELENTTCKFLMNSLYGKFGTRGNIEKLVDPDTVELDGTETYVGDLVCIPVEREPPAYANVLWAAWTTALARIRLHKMLVSLLKLGHEPLYCDTDSVFFQTRPGTIVPGTGPGLGEWKLVERILEFEARAPKVYSYTTSKGKEVRAKGVPRVAHDDKGKPYFPAETFFNGGTAKWAKPLKMREAEVQGLMPNFWIEAKKSLKTTYQRRTILKSGKTVPLVIGG